jgi:hypothetical protein
LLTEYLYIDSRRLDSYTEQISSPVTYDKVPTWNVELSITGPKASGSQSRFSRPKTTHEKVKALLTFLEEKKLLTSSRGRRQEQFGLETRMATKVFLPEDSDGPVPGRDLVLWLSSKNQPEKTGLCLIEDTRGDDMPLEHEGQSGYSLLNALLDHTNKKFQSSLVGEALTEYTEGPKYYEDYEGISNNEVRSRSDRHA